MKLKHLSIALLASSLLAFVGCKFRPGEGISWDTHLLLPIAKSDVGIMDIVKSDSLIEVGTDNLVKVVYRDTMLGLSVDDYLVFPDKVQSTGVSLRTMELTTDTIVKQITLGFLARQLVEQGNPNGQYILNAHGSVLPFFPPTAGLTAPPVEIDASQFFQQAHIIAGAIKLEIYNGLPLHLSNVSFELANNSTNPPNNDLLIQDNFPHIYSEQFISKAYPMAGKTMFNVLEGALTNVDVDGGFAIPIDTNDYIEVRIIAEGMKVDEAIASFPTQTVIDTTVYEKYTFGPPLEDIQIRKIGVKYAKLKISAFSSLEDTIQVTYDMLSTVLGNGQNPHLQAKINPSTNGGYNVQTDTFIIRDAVMDLSIGEGVPGQLAWNTGLYRLKLELLSSGAIVNFDLQDSVYAQFGILEVIPSYIEGYMGKDTFHYENLAGVEFNMFKNLHIGTLDLSDPKANFTVENSFGLDATADIKDLTFYNTNTGQQLAFSGPYNTANPMYITGPRIPDTSLSYTSTFPIDKNNSNLRSIINLIPNKITYNVDLFTNHNGIPSVFNNFATRKSRLNFFMDFELPLSGIVQDLTLADTVATSFSQDVLANIENVESGSLKLLIENDFPFEVEADIYIADINNNIITKMADGFLLQAGIPNASGVVTSPTKSELVKTFDNALMRDILNNGKKLIMHYKMDSKPNGQEIKIYSTYRVKTKMVGTFKYKIDS